MNDVARWNLSTVLECLLDGRGFEQARQLIKMHTRQRNKVRREFAKSRSRAAKEKRSKRLQGPSGSHVRHFVDLALFHAYDLTTIHPIEDPRYDQT